MLTGKLIVVTGGAGFVGTNLCGRLQKNGNRVISLDNYFAGSHENHLAGVEYREGHTKDIAKHISETPDIIFHLGEYSRVEQSVLEPDVVEDLNVAGTTGVLEFWKEKKCKLVYAGSSTKFGDGGLTRTTSPYAATKAANTERVKELGERERLPYAITYFYNVYGPGERAGVYGTVIEAFKQMYLRGAPLTVVSPGTQQRNFTHVDDIVDGLLLVGENGSGDEYGLGNDRAYSLLEVAKLFNTSIVMMPPRVGNRMQSGLDTSKSAGLGWKTARNLEDYIHQFVTAHSRGAVLEKRVLVLSTTFHPHMGPAERALCALMASMPDMHFDIVTTHYSKDAKDAICPVENATVHRVGFGYPSDKYLLPLLGAHKARQLLRTHEYLFVWSVMASYGALAAAFLRRVVTIPLLITLADQSLESLAWYTRTLLRFILRQADQVYAFTPQQAQHQSMQTLVHRSLGEGDAFANQIRFAYNTFLKSG